LAGWAWQLKINDKLVVSLQPQQDRLVIQPLLAAIKARMGATLENYIHFQITNRFSSQPSRFKVSPVSMNALKGLYSSSWSH
jgi:hypothetical protein